MLPVACFDLTFQRTQLSSSRERHPPHHTIKAQALADFIDEITRESNEDDLPWADSSKDVWTLMTNGLTTTKGAAAGCVLISPVGQQLKYAMVLSFKAPNNEAEYKALITDHLIAWGTRVNRLHIRCDSQLVVH